MFPTESTLTIPIEIELSEEVADRFNQIAQDQNKDPEQVVVDLLEAHVNE